ncbi:hypothetical protein Hanom_Chr07g00679681 [Helianthus anomalus]
MVPLVYQILDLVLSFLEVHVWPRWFALCNAFSPKLFPKVNGWSMWFALCNTFSPYLGPTKRLKPSDLLGGD